jgi:type III secretion protein Q
MNDATVSLKHPKTPKDAPKLGRPAGAPKPVKLAPARKLSRAHYVMQFRPALTEAVNTTCASVSKALSEWLSVPTLVKAELLDATMHPLRTLSSEAHFALIQLGNDGLALLELELELVAQVLAKAAGSTKNCVPPFSLTRIEEAALGATLLKALQQMRANETLENLARPRLVSLLATRQEALSQLDSRRRHVAVSLSIELDGQALRARLCLPATWLESVAQKSTLQLPAAIRSEVAQAQLEFETSLVGPTLLPEQVQQLREGDVLVLPSVTRVDTQLFGHCHLRRRGTCLAGTAGPQGFSFHHLTTLEHTMSANVVDVTLPVEIEVELTRLRLPVHQLSALQEGAVIPLHLSAAQQVTLRIGDRPVAIAELVDIEGEIGARILSLIGRVS